jgi:hypothetical protein
MQKRGETPAMARDISRRKREMSGEFGYSWEEEMNLQMSESGN